MGKAAKFTIAEVIVMLLGTLSNDGGDDAKDDAKKKKIFYRRLSHIPRSVQCVYRSQNFPKLNM